MSPIFIDLPGELIENICQNLDSASLCFLRLVCKALDDKCFQSWAKQCFTTVRTDFSSDSLERLEAIASTEVVRQQVQTLFIQSTYRGDFGAKLPWFRNEDGHLLNSQPSTHALRIILCQRLPNCRSFYIHGPNDEANERINITTTEMTTLILNLIAETGLNIRSFSVDLKGDHPSSTSHGSGWLSGPRLQSSLIRHGERFREGWAYLRSLHLHIDIKSETARWTCDLVQLAPNLKSLSLTFDYAEEEACRKTISLNLPPLQELCLRSAYLTEKVLLRFLDSSRLSLQALKLRFIHLDASLDAGGTWGSVLQGLSEDFAQLKSISLFGIHRIRSIIEMPGSSPERSRVFFTPLAQDARIPNTQGEHFDLTMKKIRQKPRVIGVSYQGNHMREALTMLEESADFVDS